MKKSIVVLLSVLTLISCSKSQTAVAEKSANLDHTAIKNR